MSLARAAFIPIPPSASPGFDHADAYVAIGDPGVVCSFDSERLEQLETVATEQGAHTIGWDPLGRCLYVFCPAGVCVAVYEERV